VFDFRGFFSSIKRYWLLYLITIMVAVVFFGGIIVGLYNKARAALPVLPAAKVS